MSAELIVRPGMTIPSRGDFISTHDPYAVALDGYVDAPPFFERTAGGPYRNFDHHTGVDRLATLSSGQQVLRALRMGFVEAFTQDGDYRPTVYTNQCDQDVSLAWYLLSHAPDIASIRIKRVGAPLRNLVDMAGDLDVTAGAYPYPPRLALMGQIAWMFRPFTEVARVRRELTEDPAQYREIIGQCCGRIALYIAGRGEEVALDTRHRTMGTGDGWRMIREIGAEGRIGAFNNPEINACIFYKGERRYSAGVHDVALWKRSEYVECDWTPLVEHMNELEGLTGADRWGLDGSGMNGGSPREAGTRIDPYTLMDIARSLPLTSSRN